MRENVAVSFLICGPKVETINSRMEELFSAHYSITKSNILQITWMNFTSSMLSE